MALGLEVLDRAARDAGLVGQVALRPAQQAARAAALGRQENFCVGHLALPGLVTHIG
ncbi:hypothetical protein D3C87_2134070 [compost metagenome]